MSKRFTRGLVVGTLALGLGLSATAFAAGGAGGGGGGGGGGGTATGGGGGGGGTATGGGGGGTKVGCVNAVSVTGTATESLTGNAFSATYALTSCQSKTHVGITVTDLSTNQIVFSLPDTAVETVFWNLPYELTSYRVDARAYATVSGVLTTVATGTTQLDTLDALPCTPSVVESTTVGYFGIYPAVWEHHDSQDCGLGGQVYTTITNTQTGQVVVNDLPVPLTYTLDYEGAVVPYDTPFHVQVELRSRTGAVLSTDSDDVITSPSR